jgi:hypothetical protein
VRRTATVLTLSTALLAPAPAFAQEASPSPATSPCNAQRGFVTLGTPSPRSIVAGEAVTYTATLTGPLENYADHTNNSYRWATPSTKAPAEVTSADEPILDRLEEGETATRTVTLLPTTNTRLLYSFGYATPTRRCLNADGQDSDVIDVAPRLTLTAVRNGVRDYTFSGVATTPGLILNLYRVNADGTKVLTSQARADADRTWKINRKFLGSGRFGFVVLTGRTMANAPGVSNTRPTVIH